MLNKVFAKLSVSNAPVGRPLINMSYEQLKASFKLMPTDVLQQTYKQACERGRKEQRVPLTIKVLSDLHREARYVVDGKPYARRIAVDHHLNAFDFVNYRDLVSNMPRARVRTPGSPKKKVMWAADVVEREPNNAFLAKVGRLPEQKAARRAARRNGL